MVVSYKNKFIKVFLISLLLGLVSLTGLVWIIRSIYSATSNVANSNSTDLILNSRFLILFGLIFLVAEGLYIYSHYLLAKAKGYSAWLTLLGLLNSFIGLAIIFFLPDKRKDNSTIASVPQNNVPSQSATS